jgi:CheY-like chemotaxis protein
VIRRKDNFAASWLQGKSLSEHPLVLVNRRVLIVEDEALIAMAVEEEVRDLGCTDATVAYNRDAAIAAMKSFRPDFAVLDVRLTDVGEDYEIADLLDDTGVPFIFSSGHVSRNLPDRHVGRPFVGKPMQPQEFVEAVSMALKA